MRRLVPAVFGLLLSCASASDPAPTAKSDHAQPPAETAQPPSKTSTPSAAPAASVPTTDCGRAEARYSELLNQHNRCDKDEDCAEIYPGACNKGPYYTHIDTDHAAIEAAASAMRKACEPGACPKPQRLPIAHCEAGRCEQGRSKPEERDDESCWDTEITYMRTGSPYLASSYAHLQGITPLHAVSVPADGRLRVSTRMDCSTCTLMVSERNTGMASLIKGRSFTPAPDGPKTIKPVTSRAPPRGPITHLEFTVQPGPYFMVVTGGPGDVQYTVELLDRAGAPMAPNRRGRIHKRICEG